MVSRGVGQSAQTWNQGNLSRLQLASLDELGGSDCKLVASSWTLDAKASRLNWIIRLAQNINDAPIFEMNFQAAQRVTELTGTVHYRVWLQRT